MRLMERRSQMTPALAAPPASVQEGTREDRAGTARSTRTGAAAARRGRRRPVGGGVRLPLEQKLVSPCGMGASVHGEA